MNSLLRSKFVYGLTLILVVQAVMFYSASHGEMTPLAAPLAAFPLTVGGWHMKQEGVIDKETQDILKADDYLTREYAGLEAADVNLYMAYFKTQRQGQSPHSPKNCLPGSGWTQLSSNLYTIQMDTGKSIAVNRYVVSHGQDRSLVMYWYQSRDRVVADEFKAKFWVMADSLRFNRTDTALVRVVVPIVDQNEDDATNTAVDFVKSFYQPLHNYLPA